MTVAVPEKTLEHWASIYLTYRYKSHASLWWPTVGSDILMGNLPQAPGKRIELELKTCTPSGKTQSASLQEVHVNLGQLWAYNTLPLGEQPFYVFPKPSWRGELRDRALDNGLDPADLAFSRSGDSWWFAEWMVVLSTHDVAKILEKPLKSHGSASRKGSDADLVKYTIPKTISSTTPVTEQWGPSGTSSPSVCRDPIPWRDFWTRLEVCGCPDWPQRILLPSTFKERSYQAVSEELEKVSKMSRKHSEKPNNSSGVNGSENEDKSNRIITLVSTSKGFITEQEITEQKHTNNSLLSEIQFEHHISVFIDAKALFPEE